MLSYVPQVVVAAPHLHPSLEKHDDVRLPSYQELPTQPIHSLEKKFVSWRAVKVRSLSVAHLRQVQVVAMLKSSIEL